MSGKSISNGTLSLRFMQNAARAKQLAHAELEQAKVNDDAEWEVPAVIRAAWGANGSTRRVSHSDENIENAGGPDDLCAGKWSMKNRICRS
jgi:hypothetical protein